VSFFATGGTLIAGHVYTGEFCRWSYEEPLFFLKKIKKSRRHVPLNTAYLVFQDAMQLLPFILLCAATALGQQKQKTKTAKCQ
jgi:hypothetical protein